MIVSPEKEEEQPIGQKCDTMTYLTPSSHLKYTNSKIPHIIDKLVTRSFLSKLPSHTLTYLDSGRYIYMIVVSSPELVHT